MKLNRFKNKGYCFENKIVSVGKNFNKGYFIAFIYPFVDFGKDIYRSQNKPKFRNIFALAALLSPVWFLMAIVGVVWAILYTLYTIFGGANIVSGIKESRELGGFINIASIFCVTFFYLAGMFYIIKTLVW